MKKIFIALAAISVASFSFAPPAGLSIGDELPKATVSLKDVSGKEITLKDAAKANGLLVMFSCNTCPVVKENQARTKEVLTLAQQNNIGVVVLNSNEANRQSVDSYEAMQAYSKEQGYQWVYAVDKDNELADAFGATKTPEVFMFSSTGKLVYHGAIDDSPQDADAASKPYLKNAIAELTTGKAISVSTSKSIGCSIKRAKS